MKPISTFTFFLLTLIAVSGFAQKETSKLDKIIKRDNQIVEGKVSKITEQTIEYSFPNETLINSLEIIHVARIEFANGRVQSFDLPDTGSPDVQNASSTADQGKKDGAKIKENVIAVLPIPYVNSDNLSSSEEMAKFAQNDVYSKLIEKSSNIFPLTVQDLRKTNSLLRKAGIDYKNIDETPIDELHEILGVDHIVAAKVSYTVSINQTSSTYNSGNTKYKENKKSNIGFSSTNSNTNELFSYHVYFDLYKNNNKIYTHTRQPLFNFKDSWIDAMAYLLKRSPIYVK